MNKIPYEERVKTYTNALCRYGSNAQMVERKRLPRLHP